MNYLFCHFRFVRDLYTTVWNFKHRAWVRFAKRHMLWLNVTQDYIKEFENKPIWPTHE